MFINVILISEDRIRSDFCEFYISNFQYHATILIASCDFNQQFRGVKITGIVLSDEVQKKVIDVSYFSDCMREPEASLRTMKEVC